MAATAGASGLRAWLQAQHLTWLTPRRMRAVTIGLLIAAFAISSVGISSSTPPPAQAPTGHRHRQPLTHAPQPLPRGRTGVRL